MSTNYESDLDTNEKAGTGQHGSSENESQQGQASKSDSQLMQVVND